MIRSFDRTTGAALGGLDHLRQSIADILTTPIGTRVMRRDYGSNLLALVDQPLNEATLLRLYAETVQALANWEPRVRIARVSHLVDRANQGRGALTLDLFSIATGERFATVVPL